MWLVDLFATGGFGTVVGLLGSYLTKREERKQYELDAKHKLQMAEIRFKEVELENSHEIAIASKNIERAEVEGSIKIDGIEAKAFVESVKNSHTPIGVKLVDSIRGLMRPIITVYLLIVATILTFKIDDLVGGLTSLGPEKLFALYEDVIMQVVFLTATAVTWWFGSRPSRKK
jgi:hypothetical protein